MKRWEMMIALLLLAAAIGGCQGNLRDRWWENWGKPKGEEWTILCVDLRDEDRTRQADAYAAELKRAAGIRPDDVRIHDDGDSTQVLYGTYYRQIDKRTGKLLIPDQLRDDLRLVQGGEPGRGGRFYGAEAIPAPWTDVGNPAWNLDRARGSYTLMVALFENTPDFYDRKSAAAAYAKELRQRGFEAYYHHGKLTSEVTVGTFGPDAIRTVGRAETIRDPSDPMRYVPAVAAAADYSPEVKRLIQRDSSFRYLLRNMRRESARGPRGRHYTASRLIEIPNQDELW